MPRRSGLLCASGCFSGRSARNSGVRPASQRTRCLGGHPQRLQARRRGSGRRTHLSGPPVRMAPMCARASHGHAGAARAQVWFARQFPAYTPNSLLVDNALATMGAGLPSAIAAKIVRPTHLVLAVVGDGGYMMASHVRRARPARAPPGRLACGCNGKSNQRTVSRCLYRACHQAVFVNMPCCARCCGSRAALWACACILVPWRLVCDGPHLYRR